jgi:hypothetical protein
MTAASFLGSTNALVKSLAALLDAAPWCWMLILSDSLAASKTLGSLRHERLLVNNSETSCSWQFLALALDSQTPSLSTPGLQ